MQSSPSEGLFYTVHPTVFARFPGFLRGVVLAYDVVNGPSPASLIAMMRAEESALRQRLSSETLITEPRIQSWREAFRSLGVKPSEYRPSIDALARRVLRSDPLPSINILVDIGNLLSLRHLVPVGGHAIDQLTEDIALRPAEGNEEFIALGSDLVEHPEAGELIFVEGSRVLTRRWVWRQSNHTLTLPESRAVEINIDVLPPVSRDEMDQICAEVITLVRQFCGGRFRTEILSPQTPKISLAE